MEETLDNLPHTGDHVWSNVHVRTDEARAVRVDSKNSQLNKLKPKIRFQKKKSCIFVERLRHSIRSRQNQTHPYLSLIHI